MATDGPRIGEWLNRRRLKGKGKLQASSFRKRGEIELSQDITSQIEPTAKTAVAYLLIELHWDCCFRRYSKPFNFCNLNPDYL